MDDLITRLTAAIDQSERVAQGAAESVNRNNADGFGQPAGSEWTADGGLVIGEREALWDCEGSTTLCMSAEVAVHVASNDPAQVLRGCAADRKLVALHKPLEVWCGTADPKYWPSHAAGRTEMVCEQCDDHDSEHGWEGNERFPCGTIRAVAERYGLEADGG